MVRFAIVYAAKFKVKLMLHEHHTNRFVEYMNCSEMIVIMLNSTKVGIRFSHKKAIIDL